MVDETCRAETGSGWAPWPSRRATDSASALIKWGKNTCHLLIHRCTAHKDHAHSTLNFSGGKSFLKVMLSFQGCWGKMKQGQYLKHMLSEWKPHRHRISRELQVSIPHSRLKCPFPGKQGYNGISTYKYMRKEKGGELEDKSCPWFGARESNIGEAEKTHKGQKMNDCLAPKAGRNWCIEYWVVLSKHTGQ